MGGERGMVGWGGEREMMGWGCEVRGGWWVGR